MKLIFTILLVISFHFHGIAQNRLWFSAALETTIFTKYLEFKTSFNTRFYDVGRYDKVFPELSLNYELFDWWDVNVDYRWIFNQSRNSYERTRRHRINLNTEPKIEFGRFKFETRLRLQYGFRRIAGMGNYEPDFDNALRAKATLKYNIANFKTDPRIESEWFYNTNLGQFGRQFVKYRFAVGVKVKLPKDHDIIIKYRYDYEFNLANPNRFHVLSLAYKFEYDREGYRYNP